MAKAVRSVRRIAGGVHRDARGTVCFVNDFDFSRVDRFYTVKPSRVGELRGWVGHRRDWKWFYVARGTFDIGVVKVSDCAAPDRTAPVECFRLEAESPAVLEVPPGYFTASRSRSRGAILTVFSSGKIESARTDDFRQPADFWKLPRTTAKRQ